MTDRECVNFMQWALPVLDMQWSGFRKIRSRVCKRIQRRITSLHLDSTSAYQEYLNANPAEWKKLDELCRVTISRFYRDKMVFTFLEQEVLPSLAIQATSRGEKMLTVWSAGCASGEEPYTLALLWELCLKLQFPELQLHILATDSEAELLQRAKRASYKFSSIKNLPVAWREKAFQESNGAFHLDPLYQRHVEFQCQDVRDAMPDGPFDLVLCRNLVFTYFNQQLQTTVGRQLASRVQPGGALVIGVHEAVPQEIHGLAAWSPRLGIYRKT